MRIAGVAGGRRLLGQVGRLVHHSRLRLRPGGPGRAEGSTRDRGRPRQEVSSLEGTLPGLLSHLPLPVLSRICKVSA